MNNMFKIHSIIIIVIISTICMTSCKKSPNSPLVSTTVATDITQTTANSGGNVTDDGGAEVAAHGICWGTSTNPSTSGSKTIDGTGMGSFISIITGLSPNTKYYVKAYATNSAGTAYGSEISFITSQIVLATLTTNTVTSLTSTTAVSGGNITADGGAAITEKGVCWSTTANPTVALTTKTTQGAGVIGTFTSDIAGLLPGTTYYVKAFATNNAGTAYGNEVTFKTESIIPTVITTAISNKTQTSAISGGNITSDGGTALTAKGVCWSTSTEPTMALTTKTNDIASSNPFISLITGLTANTTYYVRAYATNSVGTAYGNELSFTTSASLATVITTSITKITSNSASSGGNVTSDGGSTVTARGVCWSTSVNPTVNNSKTTDQSGTGSFTSNLIGLKAGTTYYVKAYAINSIGTVYSNNQETFTTSLDIIFNPDLTYGTLSDIDGNTYKTIQIGTQTWMAENLRTTKYNDGIDIPLVTGNYEWAYLTTAAYCWYNNDPLTYKNTYGALYNWFTAANGRLCPVDWHVPSDAEWITLTTYLGGTGENLILIAGGKLKEIGTTHWVSPNADATNESGFTALPSAGRGSSSGNIGKFSGLGGVGYWWSVTEDIAPAVWWRIMYYSNNEVHRFTAWRTNGASVRCLKDN